MACVINDLFTAILLETGDQQVGEDFTTVLVGVAQNKPPQVYVRGIGYPLMNLLSLRNFQL
jgi:hypothetical protein